MIVQTILNSTNSFFHIQLFFHKNLFQKKKHKTQLNLQITNHPRMFWATHTLFLIKNAQLSHFNDS